MRRKRADRRRGASLGRERSAEREDRNACRKRTPNIAIAVDALNQGVFAEIPPNDDPLSDAVAA
ncbi:MAG TPA: hypothetical protein VG326_04860 [Tepidisphaeraceae bacterium]|nr:hypothetical protein [Tepidisphaeraceae bacterium]